jgi:O-phosphoseryl-tRNA(Cys) synthetase
VVDVDERKILKRISEVLSVSEADVVKTLERFRRDIKELKSKKK